MSSMFKKVRNLGTTLYLQNFPFELISKLSAIKTAESNV